MLIAFILTAVTLYYVTTHLLAVVKDKNTSRVIIDELSGKGLLSKFLATV